MWSLEDEDDEIEEAPPTKVLKKLDDAPMEEDKPEIKQEVEVAKNTDEDEVDPLDAFMVTRRRKRDKFHT